MYEAVAIHPAEPCRACHYLLGPVGGSFPLPEAEAGFL